jgi:putative addiction module CopG family antidote
MAMTSMNVSLPEELKEYVEAQTRAGYSTPSEYMRELIREDQKRRAKERLDTLLLEGSTPVVRCRPPRPSGTNSSKRLSPNSVRQSPRNEPKLRLPAASSPRPLGAICVFGGRSQRGGSRALLRGRGNNLCSSCQAAAFRYPVRFRCLPPKGHAPRAGLWLYGIPRLLFASFPRH